MDSDSSAFDLRGRRLGCDSGSGGSSSGNLLVVTSFQVLTLVRGCQSSTQEEECSDHSKRHHHVGDAGGRSTRDYSEWLKDYCASMKDLFLLLEKGKKR